jgi:hypothetical protein
MLVSAASPRIAFADQLRPETLNAWNKYAGAAKARIESRLATGQQPFLWIDEDRQRAQRVQRGDILVTAMQGSNPRKVPHGLIHDWLGAVFLPHTTLDAVLHVLNNYSQYQEYYKPHVMRSRLLKDDGDQQSFALVLVEKGFGVTAAIDTDMDAQVVRIDATRAYRYSSTTRVQAIEHFGRPDERKFTAETGPGYVWRLVMGSRLEQRDGGVYLEMETIVMSRGIPSELGWLIGSLTQRVPRDLVTRTLRATREAVAQETTPASPTDRSTLQK